ncbi:MAG: hypothetical protein Q7R39_11220, partial [Dehalococcoidia bacterium]|nr:hypothetical protein [Dehalococcoidia bacterium]
MAVPLTGRRLIGFMAAALAFLALVACSPAAPAATPTKAPAASTPAGSAAPTATSAPAKTATPAAAAATRPASVKPLDPPITIKIGVTGAIGDGLFRIADAKGYFAAEGLKPEYVPFRSATEMVAPLGVGDLDM